jgi:hypothetical protein
MLVKIVAFTPLIAVAAVVLCSFAPVGVSSHPAMESSAPPLLQAGVTSEFETTLFLQNPHAKGVKGVEAPGVLLVVSVPEPIQKYCMGKTAQVCSAIDFCIRTTTKSVAMCQNLPASLRHLPPYPPDMEPNRVYSISFMQGAPNIPGFDLLRQYYDQAPKASLDTLSEHAQFQAKIRFTRTATDGQFSLVEVLSTPNP